MSHEKRAQLFRNLVAAAAVDGRISEEERAVLAWCARGLGVDEGEFLTAVAMATAGALKVVVPRDPQEREWTLQTLARIIQADGKITPGERRLVVAVAGRMGLSDAELESRLTSSRKK